MSAFGGKAMRAVAVQAVRCPNKFRWCRYCATLKPNDFPDRLAPGRFLNRFEMSSALLSSGALLDDKNNKNQFRARPIVASCSGEHHHGTGTSV
jgi:hypothetical protein